MDKKVVNILFFLRNEELRIPQLDLFEVFKKQVTLANKYDFPATYLFEYDALIDERYIEYIKKYINGQSEIGGWWEIVKPLCEKADIRWRGREDHNWDWHCYCGFSVGYTNEERKKLLDVYMAEFFNIFGKYPKTLGSWLIDAYTLEYAEKRYGVEASTNCRDQWGTDGYTLWGGYYGPCYYPSKNNAFCPAQTKEEQINIPVFRIWATDYLHQYDYNIDLENKTYANSGMQQCITLEPATPENRYGGSSVSWTDWYIDEVLMKKTLNFGYLVTGQENSFLWEDQQKGLKYQFDKISKMSLEGKIELMTMAETAQQFKKEFEFTPPSVQFIESDYREGFDCKSLWYNSRNYRCNLYFDEDRMWIRDIFLFREEYSERCKGSVCVSNDYCYDNLPFTDGCLWCGNGTRSGLYIFLCCGGKEVPLSVRYYVNEYIDGAAALLTCKTQDGDIVSILMNEQSVTVSCDTADIKMRLLYDGNAEVPFKKCEENTIFMEHNSFEYKVEVKGANIELSNGITISGKDKIELLLGVK